MKFWVIILIGALLRVSLGETPLTKLHTIDDFQSLSNTLTKVAPQAKAATVCIDLGGGSSGSGVVISKDGLILSAAHVTQSVGEKFDVIFEDGTRYQAVGLGLNTTSDASMAKIIASEENPEFPFATLSTNIKLRQYAFSLGHSGGFDKDRGVVMRLGRITDINEDSMQTDCTLIGGDSGGPLFDLEGNLIGIHSRVGTITSSNTHVPIENFQKHWDDLKAGKVWGDGSFADAGILIQGMRVMQRETILEVIDVKEGSNAEKAGILAGDILVKLDGQKVATIKEIFTIISDEETFKRAKLNGLSVEVTRGDSTKQLTLSIDE